MPVVRFVVIGLLAALSLASCSRSSGHRSASATTPTSSASGSGAGSAPGAAPSTTAAPTPCPAGGPRPAGPTKDVGSGDVDGDGQIDAFAVDDRGQDQSGPETIRLTTARGVRAALTVPPENVVGVLGVVALASGPAVLIEQGRNTANPSTVQVVVFHNCQLVLAHNAQGEPYSFDVWPGGDGNHPEGVGCLTDGGATRLVGLRGDRISATQVKWTRTAVDINGDQARNGDVQSGTYTSPQDDKGIDLLSTVSCGERRLEQLT